ncbi:molybdopterin oxidoreductase family protein [Nocardiopsis xinjiangensis]|uniref:molybdopterin oxidoreductase family protein n=1 Tax=Nocardiopsis xinjiangensis TaxID=124285 RepID=UPI000348A210|nr:molybdopterin-dependent oxidoreductase [Nocardiopsis xinjiangensis]
MRSKTSTAPLNRLTSPLVRENGELRPASWEEALERAAAGFRAGIDQHGPDSFGMLSCARATNEMNFMVQKFARAVMGTNNVDSCNRTCHAPSVAGLAAAFGSGGGTSSYAEIEDTDLIVVWGGNPRSAHPIFFQHVLKGVRRGAKLFVIDPRRTSTAEWADRWLGLNVGTDIPLAHAVGREILYSGLANETFIERATSGLEEYRALVEPWTLSAAEAETGVPAEAIRELAHAYALADRAQLCWTLGITEHHNATDNVRALINLSLLTGHVGRHGAGLNPLRGQNNVQGGGDMGAIPDRLAGFQDILDADLRAPFEAAWGSAIQGRKGKNLTQMFEAMGEGDMKTLYVIGENPVQSEPETEKTTGRLRTLNHLVVQDIFLTRTAELADVVLPASASWCESDGTFTNSERRVQLVRKALDPPQGARDDIDILCDMAERLGTDWGRPSAEEIWDELRSLSPIHRGMSYDHLAQRQGIQWPCYSEEAVEPSFLHGRLWSQDPQERGEPAAFGIVGHSPPVDLLDEEYPFRLTTGRRLDDYNTGVQTSGFSSPMRRGELLDLSPEDADKLGIQDGETVRVCSRRGSVLAPASIDSSMRAGLVFMTFHFPDQVDTQLLTIDATDPIAGTAEYKAAAVRIERVAQTAGAAEGALASPG